MPRYARFYPNAVLCSALLVLAILISHPVAEVGINDDWSYIRSAQLMEQTGHIHYVGWASAMLGWMLPLGALFIKLFGFSFTVVRASVAFLAVATAFLLQRCFVRSGLNEWNGTLAALTILFSPIYLPVATTFMTDIPGLITTLICYYVCLRALATARERNASGWIVLAILFSGLGGTARQTAWLGVLFLVPSTAWLLRRRRLSWSLLGLLWILAVGFIVASLRWFQHQPYALGEAVIADYIDRDLIVRFISHLLRAFLALCLFLSPILLGFLPQVDTKSRVVRRWIALSCGGVALVAAILLWRHHLTPWLAPFDGNYVTEKGLADMKEVGTRRDMLGPVSRAIITLGTLVATIGAVAFFLTRVRRQPRLPANEQHSEKAAPVVAPTLHQLLVLLGPFSLVYTLLTCHRALFASLYDRYLLVLLFPVLLILVRLYQESAGPRLPPLSVACVILFGLFSTAATHDLFSMERARVQAAQNLMDAGLDRNDFIGGWEWDGWTQIVRYGYMNNGYMYAPDGFHPLPPILRKIVHRPCSYGWIRFCPHMDPKFAVSFDEVSCDGPSKFKPVSYRSWLPPYDGKIYIQQITQPVYGP